MPWLTRDAEVLATIEPDRCRAPDGCALVLLRPLVVRAPRSHPLDVAWCRPMRDPAGASVLEVRRLGRVGGVLPGAGGWRAPVAVVAEGGAFDRWRLGVGDRLEITGG